MLILTVGDIDRSHQLAESFAHAAARLHGVVGKLNQYNIQKSLFRLPVTRYNRSVVRESEFWYAIVVLTVAYLLAALIFIVGKYGHCYTG